MPPYLALLQHHLKGNNPTLLHKAGHSHLIPPAQELRKGHVGQKQVAILLPQVIVQGALEQSMLQGLPRRPAVWATARIMV